MFYNMAVQPASALKFESLLPRIEQIGLKTRDALLNVFGILVLISHVYPPQYSCEGRLGPNIFTSIPQMG